MKLKTIDRVSLSKIFGNGGRAFYNKAGSMEQQSSFIEKEEPIFSREKSLLTVEQYATGQKVSTAIVDQCAKLGVVQVRRHKNKTFIVDLPLNTYKMLRNKDRQSEAEERTNTPKIRQPLPKSIVNSPNTTTLSEKQLHLTAAGGRPTRTEDASLWPTGLGVVPDLKLFAEDELTSPTLQLGTAAQKKKTVTKFRIPLLRSFAERVKSIPLQKLYFGAMAAGLVIAISAYTMARFDKTAQQKKLHQAYENINNLTNEYENTRQTAKLHEFDMLNWRSEAERSRRAVRNYQTELSETRRKLYETKKDLNDMRQFNTETLQQLTEKLNNLNQPLPAE